MRLKPNDLPEMERGETRNVTFKLAGAVGVNSISDVEMGDCNGLTFGSPVVNGRDVTVLVTAVNTGVHNIVITADLASDEVVKGFCRAHVVDSSCREESGDYE